MLETLSFPFNNYIIITRHKNAQFFGRVDTIENFDWLTINLYLSFLSDFSISFNRFIIKFLFFLRIRVYIRCLAT